ncbi:MAG: serine hydrolase domain-containing protein [Actinomycetota bacterium]
MLVIAGCGGDGDPPAEADADADDPTEAAAEASSTTSTTTTTTTTTAPPTTSVAPGPTAEQVRERIETGLMTASGTTSLTDRMAEQAVPGLAVAVVIDGEPLTAFAVGTTPSGTAMTESTLIQVGSVSKPVAALTVLSVAAEGGVDLDADIETLLTSYALPAGEQTAANPVTLARLLAHDAGTNVDGFLGYASAAESPARPDLLAGGGNTDAVTVVQAPGSGFLYSGGGYELMAQTLADATGSDWDTLVADAIFGPAGMADSFYALDLTAEQAARATEGSVNGEMLGNGWQAHPEGAAAGLWTTAEDLASLVAAFSRSLAGTDDTLLPTEWAQRAVRPTVPTAPSGAAAQGFFVDDVEDPTRWSHGGRNIGYTAEIAGAIDGSYAVVVVTNGFPGGSDLAREIIATVEAELEVAR